MEDEQGYFCVIPTELIECGKPLKALLYGVITSYARKSGKCWASNKTLARKIGIKDDSTVSRYIQELRSEGYIDYEIDRQGGNKRILSIGRLSTPHRSPVVTVDPSPVVTDASSISNSNIISSIKPSLKKTSSSYEELGRNPLYRKWVSLKDPKPTFTEFVDSN